MCAHTGQQCWSSLRDTEKVDHCLNWAHTYAHCILEQIDDLTDILVAEGGALAALLAQHDLVAELDELAQRLVDLLCG